MNKPPQHAAAQVELVAGVSAVAPGVLWLQHARALVAADVHLAYEDVIGGALPAWSTLELVSTLVAAAERMQAHEVVLLGDVIHGSRMSEGAARAVQQGLERLRAAARLTLVAGNHEGRARGAAVLGETVESVERDGWLLLHGDRAAAGARCIIGHLHPSLGLGGGTSAPAFLACERLIVVPALTPYSRGLNVLSVACLHALRPFGIASRREMHVVAAAGDLLYPFGQLSELQKAVTGGAAPRSPYRRTWLRPDR
ncbi:MAG TPA: metallophosphoesterase [Candidatus Baltobacteraceae bacterium]